MKSKIFPFTIALALFSCEPTAETKVLNNGNLITAFGVKTGDANLDVQINGTDIQVLVPHTIDLGQILLNLTWYLVDGEELGIVSGSTGNQNTHSGECDGIGLNGTSKMLLENHLDKWDTWHEHPWHFNFRLEGEE